jgi:hypothetical protein
MFLSMRFKTADKENTFRGAARAFLKIVRIQLDFREEVVF